MAIVVWLALLEGLYVRALRILGRRGVTVPRGQIAAWHGAMTLWVVGLRSPSTHWARTGWPSTCSSTC